MNSCRELLLEISNSLTFSDLEKLKFLYQDFIPRSILERITKPFELFSALEHYGMLSEENRDFLASSLMDIGRIDLRNKLLGVQAATLQEEEPAGLYNGIVTSQLVDDLVEDLRLDWKKLGRRLMFPENLLRNIDSENRRVKEKGVAMFEEWKNRITYAPTMQVLKDALLGIGRRDLSEKVRAFALSQQQELLRAEVEHEQQPVETDWHAQMFQTLRQIQYNANKANSETDLLMELEKIASDMGFLISDNQGSGDCMFYALSEQLELVKGIKISHQELRQSLVTYLRVNPQMLDGTDLFNFVHGYQSWASYLTQMDQVGTWGDHIILYAAANCYGTCIRVISSLPDHGNITIRPHGHDQSSNPLVLGHVHEVHYVSLLPIQDVPPEILSRGLLALEAYNKALAEGKTIVKRVPIMLVGKERSGKTSLKKSLKGNSFNPHEDSTVGIDVDPSHFKVSTEIWKTGEKDQERNSEAAISYDYCAALLTVENLKVYSPDSPSADSHEFSDVVEAPQSSKASTEPDSIQTSKEIEPLVSNDPADALADTPTHTPLFEMPDGIATIIEKLLKEVEKVEDKDDIYSVLWDFGGQSVFYTTHQLFLTEKAIYLLVFDLSQNPHKRAKPVEKQGMYMSFEDSSSLKTNLDYLHFWMNSIASLGTQDETSKVGPTSETLPEKLPPVF